MIKSKKNILVVLLSLLCVLSFVFYVAQSTTSKTANADSQFYMKDGASMRLTDETGMRFEAVMSADKYDASATYGMIIFPSAYLAGYEGTDNYLGVLNARYEAGTNKNLPMVLESTPVPDNEENPTSYTIRGSITNLKYNNLNREFTAVAYKRTGEEGSYSYEYATTKAARKISYLASATIATGLYPAYLDDMQNIMVKSVAQAAGDTEADADALLESGVEDIFAYLSDKVEATIDTDFTDTVYKNVSESKSIGVERSDELDLEFVVSYVSSDASVVSVSDSNTLNFIGDGTATVSAKVGNFTLDSKSITVDTLSFSSTPTYLEKGGTSTITPSASDGLTITYASDTVSNLTVSNAGEIAGVGNGSATITITATADTYGGSLSETRTVRAIDFGNTTGNVVNFASEENLDLWSFRDGTNDGNATLTLQSGVRPVGSNDWNVLDYYRPNNNNGYRGMGNMLYLSPEIMDMAKSLGYKYLAFYIYESSTLSQGCRSFGTTATGSEYYNTKSTEGKYYNGGYTRYFISQTTGWAYKALEITESDAGTGVGFFALGQHLYLSMVKFIGADLVEVEKDGEGNITSITKNTLGDFLKDSDNDGIFDNLLATSAGINALNALNDCTVSFEYSATGGHNGAPGLIATRDTSKSANGTRYVSTNCIYIGSDLIQAAKALGCTKLGFRVKAEKWDDSKNAYVAGSSAALLRLTNINTQAKYINVNGSSVNFVISIAAFEPGQTLGFTWYDNSKITISNITFRTDADTTAITQNWPA